uniref:anthranilate synthase n=1 Tax=Gossypium raimondii TaxID=29730 RepID=A0A0D2S7L0_GOSRA|nr:hypothetical protein B456_013G032100 [Gossypium raimondii]
MAVNFVMQSSLVQPKPSLSLKTPSLPQLSRLSPPSKTKQDSQNPIILIDNYDSFFTSNLCQYLGELGCSLKVCRNDELTVEELKRHAQRLQNIIANSFGAWTIVPLLGVCMGMWCICEAFRGKTVRSPYGLKQGDSCCVYYYDEKDAGLFTGLPNPFQAGRGPDAFLDMDGFPLEALKVTAFTEDGLIMAARHKIYKYLHGVHFSQESIITSEGKIIVQNFIKLIERKEAAESQN